MNVILEHRHTLNFLNKRFCCLFLIDGLVSKECGLFLFFAETIAAAAATPTGPIKIKFKILHFIIIAFNVTSCS